MFKNYLKPAFRNLRENNLYSSINIVHLISTWIDCDFNCIDNYKFPGNQNNNAKPGGEFEE